MDYHGKVNGIIDWLYRGHLLHNIFMHILLRTNSSALLILSKIAVKSISVLLDITEILYEG